jgi:membrane carboxypeptidase/penicillin-binding protein PbpC
LLRALFQKPEGGENHQRGSTITMQVCRLARGDKKRSMKNKIMEMIWALNSNSGFQKRNFYSCMHRTPFWRNVVGLMPLLALFCTPGVLTFMGRIGNAGCSSQCPVVDLPR